MGISESVLKRQVIPVGLTVVVAVALIGVLWMEIAFLNHWTATDIVAHLRWFDRVAFVFLGVWGLVEAAKLIGS